MFTHVPKRPLITITCCRTLQTACWRQSSHPQVVWWKSFIRTCRHKLNASGQVQEAELCGSQEHSHKIMAVKQSIAISEKREARHATWLLWCMAFVGELHNETTTTSSIAKQLLQSECLSLHWLLGRENHAQLTVNLFKREHKNYHYRYHQVLFVRSRSLSTKMPLSQ